MLPGMGDSSKSVLVSGCSTSFGWRAARALSARGHTVVAGLPEPEGRHRERADLLRADGASVVSLDVDHDASVAEGLRVALRATNGELDVLVNTAAYTVMGPLEACRPNQLLSMLNTNVVGALRLFRAVMPVMRGAGHGDRKSVV